MATDTDDRTMAGLPNVDQRDRDLITERAAEYDRITGPRVGDFIDFADGITRRVSHVWPADWHDDNVARVQTTDGGSFYLGSGYISYSGALYPGLRANTLRLTGSRNGSVWVFHHDYATAHNGVDDEIAFRVFVCSLAGADPWRLDER